MSITAEVVHVHGAREAQIFGWTTNDHAMDTDEEESGEIQGFRKDSLTPSINSQSLSGRRLSRKQPPQLTESLAALALFAVPTEVPARDPASNPVSPKTLSVTLPSVHRKLSVPPGSEDTLIVEIKPLPKLPKRPLKSALRDRKISVPFLTSTPVSAEANDKRSPSPPTPNSITPTRSNSSVGTPGLDGGAMPGHKSSPSFSTATASSWSLRTPSTNDQPSACGVNGSCTWSAYDAYVWDQRARSSTHTKLSRREKKQMKKAQDKAFDADTKPTVRQMYDASILPVIDEHGVSTPFGDLIRGKRTIVVFIRHWFCPLCAQYMNAILNEVSQEALEEANVELMVIGNGSSKMLDGYRNKAFKCPFKMYTDPTLALYRALGLTRQTGNAGKDEDKGDYLVQTAMESTMQTVKRATKMPLLHNPGHFLQLGGEFIFDGTLECIYAHRMTTTRDHAPIRDVCKLAGVELEYIHYEPGSPPPAVHRESILEEEEDDWIAEREAQLERIRQLKSSRRMGRLIRAEERPELPESEEEGEEVVIIESDEVRAAREAREAREEALMRRRFSGLGIST